MASGVNLTFNLYGKDHTASKAIKGVGDESEKSHSKFGKLSKMGLAVAGGVAAAGAAAVVAGRAMVDMGLAAAEDEAAQKRLARGLRNTAGATDDQIAKVEAWISRQGEALGVTDDKLRPALQRLTQSTKDVGEAQDLSTLAMDISAATGKDLETVANALGKAHDGNVGALGRLGIATKDAEGKTLTFDQAVANMSGTFKGQAAEGANTLEGKMGRLRLMFDETKESIGAKLLPIAERLADWAINTAIPAFQRFGEQIMPKLRDAWDGIKSAFEDARPGLENIWTALKKVGEVILTKVAPVVITFYKVYWSNLLKALGKVGEFLPKLAGFFLEVADIGLTAFAGLFKGVTAALGGILEVAANTIGRLPGFEWVGEANDRFKSFRETATANIDKVRTGIDKAKDSVKAWDNSAQQARQARLKADISDAKVKIAEAMTKLEDPTLTKERKAEIKAEIADLVAKVKSANRELDSLKDKNVTITAGLVINKVAVTQGVRNKLRGTNSALLGMATGGLVVGPGSGTSDSVPAMLSAGEYVVSAAAVDRYGVGLFDALNSGGGGSLPSTGSGAPMGGITVNVYGGLDSSEAIARRVQASLLDLKRRQGVSLGLA